MSKLDNAIIRLNVDTSFMYGEKNTYTNKKYKVYFS